MHVQELSMENAKISITRAVEGEHLSTCTYTATKHRSVQHLEIILKNFLVFQYTYTGTQYVETTYWYFFS